MTRKSEDEIDNTLPEQTARIVRRPVSGRHKAGIDACVMINKKGDGRRSAFKMHRKQNEEYSEALATGHLWTLSHNLLQYANCKELSMEFITCCSTISFQITLESFGVLQPATVAPNPQKDYTDCNDIIVPLVMKNRFYRLRSRLGIHERNVH